MGLVLQLVEARADGLTRSVEVMAISRPGDLRDVANLGLTLSEAKQLLARVQQAMVAVSCTRFPWTAICPTGDRHGEVQHGR